MSSAVACTNIKSGTESLDYCPGYISGCEGLTGNYTDTVNGQIWHAAISIISSTLSCLGSLLIVFSYCMWKDIRTGSRSVVTFLAIADFFTAFGYIIGSSNYIYHYGKPPGSTDCVDFTIVCQIQSFLTSWSSISSFLWTQALALYLYCTVVHSKILLASKLIPYFHVICWGFPILVCLPLLATEKLGYSPYGAATWCYIYEPVAQFDDGLSPRTTVWFLIGGKLWELISYVVVVILYIGIKCSVRKQTKIGNENILGAGLASVVKKADRKLTFIPVVFVLLRIWGTLQFIYSWAVSSYIRCACTSIGISIGFQVLVTLQAIGDGGQGWGNVLLYVLASDKIRSRLFGEISHCLSAEDTPGYKQLNHRDRRPEGRPPSDDGHRHANVDVRKPVAINIQGQSVTYQSTVTHEPTTPNN